MRLEPIQRLGDLVDGVLAELPRLPQVGEVAVLQAFASCVEFPAAGTTFPSNNSDGTNDSRLNVRTAYLAIFCTEIWSIIEWTSSAIHLRS